MDMSQILVCTHCGALAKSTKKRSVLGQVRGYCSSCSRHFHYPFSGRFRVAFWLGALLTGVIVALGIKRAMSQAGTPIEAFGFAPLFIAFAAGLIYNALLRYRLARTRA